MLSYLYMFLCMFIATITARGILHRNQNLPRPRSQPGVGWLGDPPVPPICKTVLYQRRAQSAILRGWQQTGGGWRVSLSFFLILFKTILIQHTGARIQSTPLFTGPLTMWLGEPWQRRCNRHESNPRLTAPRIWGRRSTNRATLAHLHSDAYIPIFIPHSSIEYKSCYMVNAHQLVSSLTRGDSQADGGSTKMSGLLIGCLADLSTGDIRFLANDKETPITFKVHIVVLLINYLISCVCGWSSPPSATSLSDLGYP